MALTDTQIKQFKPEILLAEYDQFGNLLRESGTKGVRKYDKKGLYLEVTPTGAKYWRKKYRFDGKEKRLAIGVYPSVSLAQARAASDKADVDLAQGIDPSSKKKALKAARVAASENSFEVIAREWLTNRGPKSESGDKRLVRMLERDLFPRLGPRPIAEITPVELLATLRMIEHRGAVETAHRAKQYAGQVFRYAVVTGRAERDPSADLRDALKKPIETHFPSTTTPKDVAALMKAIHSYKGTPTVTAALKLSPLLFCRPGELRHMHWSEVNFEEARVELPASKMKTREPHIIPLCTQAIEILKDLELITGRGQFVFPSARGASRPLSDNGVRTALRTLGFTNEQMTPHGFRAMARTILDEVLSFPVDWIEHQLAHSVRDVNGRAYNRTKHLDQRRGMMQKWADYLDELRKS